MNETKRLSDIRLESISALGTKLTWIPLDIIPEPVDDTDNEYDIFVKPSHMRSDEPPSYNQDRSLEQNYPYITRLRVSGSIANTIYPFLSV